MNRPDTDRVLRNGDPITIVYPHPKDGASPIALLTYVTRRDGGGEVIEVALPRSTERLALSAEGTAWLRGHHAPGSPEFSAAIVAEAL